MRSPALRTFVLQPPAIRVLILLLFLTALAPACVSGPADESAAGSPGVTEAPAAAPPKPQAQMEGADKAFFVTLPAGDKVTVGVFPNPDWAGKKLLFDPPVPKLDANIHPLAQSALWEVHGRQRGHASPADMRVATREKLGSILTFKLSTGSLLCVFPLQDDDPRLMKGMFLWVE